MSIDIVNSQVLAAIARSSSLGDSLFFRKNDVSVGFHEQRPSVYPSLCVSREKTRAKTKRKREAAHGVKFAFSPASHWLLALASCPRLCLCTEFRQRKRRSQASSSISTADHAGFACYHRSQQQATHTHTSPYDIFSCTAVPYARREYISTILLRDALHSRTVLQQGSRQSSSCHPVAAAARPSCSWRVRFWPRPGSDYCLRGCHLLPTQ